MSTFGGYSASALKTIEVKTAAYQMKEGDLGKIFTNRGAGGSVTLTLPNTTGLPAGWNCRVFGCIDEEIVVASYGSSDNIMAKNDAAADSVTWAQTGEQIGAGGEFVWDGTSWLCFLMGDEAVTITAA
jgi:hypothetical protein